MKIFDFFKQLFLKIFKKDNFFYYIGGVDVLPPPLTPEEENIYLMKIKEKEPGAKEYVIEHNLRLVVYIAKKFENTRIHKHTLH